MRRSEVSRSSGAFPTTQRATQRSTGTSGASVDTTSLYVEAAMSACLTLACATFLLLRRRFSRVSYWRGKREVDFVVRRGSVPVPVQVTWDAPLERQLKGIDEFCAEHPYLR